MVRSTGGIYVLGEIQLLSRLKLLLPLSWVQTPYFVEVSPITLSSPFANAVYQWSDNSTDSTLTVSTAGEYGLELQVGACEVSDSIIINYDDLREVDLGSDVFSL